jgi:hypothetical protein
MPNIEMSYETKKIADLEKQIAALRQQMAEKNNSTIVIEKKKPSIIVKAKKEKLPDLPLANVNLTNYQRQANLLRTRTYKSDLKVAEIRKAFGSKTFHIDVKFDFNITYRKDGQKAFTTPNTTRTSSFTISAKSESEARNNIKQMVEDRLTIEENPEYQSFTLGKIHSVKVIHNDAVVKGANYKIRREPMKKASPIQFSWVNNIEFENDGLCAYNALAALKRAPKMFQNKEKLLKFFQKYESDEALLVMRDEVKLTCEYGVTPDMVQALCEKFDITHYCLDIENKILLKNVTKSSNYDPICYITHASHMYLITDKAFINKLSFTRSNANYILGMFSGDDTDDDKGTIKTKIVGDTKLDDLHTLTDCTVIMNCPDLQNMLIELYKKEQVIYKHKCKNGKINQIEYNDGVTIMADPNVEAHLYDEPVEQKLTPVTWQTVQNLCNQYNIPFKNQSFPAFVMQIVTNNVTTKRMRLTKEDKVIVKNRQDGLCNLCSAKLEGSTSEFDHITPLASNGTNDLDNIQALCRPCHFSKSKSEEEDGEYFTLESSTSTFNNTVDKIVHGDDFKRFAFIEQLGKTPAKRKSFYIDINRCRKNILYYLKELNTQIPVFTCMDEPKEFNTNDTIEPGFYFITSNNYFPLRENGWYSHYMINYCLEHHIITKDNIKYKLASSVVLKDDYFNKAIDQLLTLPRKLSKLGPNILTGCLGTNTYSVTKTFFTDDFRQASTHYMQSKSTTVSIHEVDDEGQLYQVNQTEKMQKDVVNNMIYHLILDIEACELHNLKTLIEANKGHVTYLNTDACECWFDDDIPMDISSEYWFNSETLKVLKYKYEAKIPVSEDRVERKKDFRHNDEFEFEKPTWNLTNDPMIDDFEPTAKSILESNKSINIDGIAGAGKTTLCKTIMKMLDDKGEKYKVLCPTNKSARVVSKDAMTIHKFLAKGFSNVNSLKKSIKGLSYIILDEVSMIKEPFYKIFLSIKRMSNIKFIVAGDFRQLAPVKERAIFDYKNSLALLELCDNNRLELTKCRRSDKELFNDSLQLDTLDINKYGKLECDVSICWTNKKRKLVNAKWMEVYAKEAKDFITFKKLSYDSNSQDVKVYTGMPIISRVNNRKLEIYNNETFTIKKINESTMLVTDGGQDIEIENKFFQSLFYPAYCMTTYKIQGTTITKPFTIYQWKHFDTKMKYTSFTRGTKREDINIIA